MRHKIVLISALMLPLVLPLAAQAAPDGGKLGRYFTPEQRAMLMMQGRDQAKNMSPDERKTFRKDQVARLMAMSDGDRAKLKADLQAQWDALPQKRKDRLEQRIAERQNPAPATPVAK